MAHQYFTDCNDSFALDSNLLIPVLQEFLQNNYFAENYPKYCRDGRVCGTDVEALRNATRVRIPKMGDLWLTSENFPNDCIFDITEFFFQKISKSNRIENHDWYGPHSDLYDFSVPDGQQKLSDEINTVFFRNSMPYELTSEGRIIYLGAPVHRELVLTLDELSTNENVKAKLTSAKDYLSYDVNKRRTSLESLWDAFEYFKDVYSKTAPLIDQHLNGLIKKELKALGELGNSTYSIRHSKMPTSSNPLQAPNSREIDYLFYRMHGFLILISKIIPLEDI